MKNFNKLRMKSIVRTPDEKLIHVKLDAKTRITISKMSQLDAWLIKYPNAVVVPV